MKKLAVLFAALVCSVVSSLPAEASHIQHFGYTYATDDDALGKTKNYTNVTHIAAEAPSDSYFRSRVDAINQRGLKVTIDLTKIFFCGTNYLYLCGTTGNTWQDRWNTWKTYNASILTSSKVVGVMVRDEPLLAGVSLSTVQSVAAYIKTDPALASWLKVFWIESACKVTSDVCGADTDGDHAFTNATASIPSIDWIGVSKYAIYPKSDWEFQTAVSRMKTKYPNKSWIYVGDSIWTTESETVFYPHGNDYLGTIASDWYDVAEADQSAVFLLFFNWQSEPGAWTGARDLPCFAIKEHVRIGRAITGKTRGSAPIGTYSIDSLGIATGWTCDPDQTFCETNPRIEVRVDGTYVTAMVPPNDGTFTNLQCGMDQALKFKITLPRSSQTKTINLKAVDNDSPGATVVSTCPGAPNCTWTSHLKYFGYLGTADDTANRGLNETKGYTNFSHIAQGPDPASTFVRDRVTAMNARGVKATIDLGQLFWCGTNWRVLCTDWQARWNTWKTTNLSILSPDKVLAMTVRDEPFNYDVNMTQYDQAAAFVKADPLVGSWVKLWLIEAGCVVANGNCGVYSGSNAWNRYTGTLPSTDWIGIDEYKTHPATNSTFQSALAKVKTKFPSKPRIYVMDGYWTAGHQAVFGTSINNMKDIAREWYDAAHNDPGAIMLGVYAWNESIGSKDFPCTVLSEHREIGREITLKRRLQTAAPIGKLESLYDGSGLAIGYACDPDGSICENPAIEFWANGMKWNTTTNYPSRTDFVTNAACGVGVAYRFRQNVNSNTSGYNVTAFAKDLDVGGTWLASNCAENPACLWYSTFYEAKGYMQEISPTGQAAGWVCDPDAPHLSTFVRLALADGTPIGMFQTNLGSEQAVADECLGGYLHRFSVQLPTWTRYQPIVAYSQDTVSGETLIPWLCGDGGWECQW